MTSQTPSASPIGSPIGSFNLPAFTYIPPITSPNLPGNSFLLSHAHASVQKNSQRSQCLIGEEVAPRHLGLSFGVQKPLAWKRKVEKGHSLIGDVLLSLQDTLKELWLRLG